MLSGSNLQVEREYCLVGWMSPHLDASSRHATPGTGSPVRAGARSYSPSPGSCPDDASLPSTPVRVNQSQQRHLSMLTNHRIVIGSTTSQLLSAFV